MRASVEESSPDYGRRVVLRDLCQVLRDGLSVRRAFKEGLEGIEHDDRVIEL